MTYLQIEVSQDSAPSLPEFRRQDVEVGEVTLAQCYRYDMARDGWHFVIDWAAVGLLRHHRSPDDMGVEGVLDLLNNGVLHSANDYTNVRSLVASLSTFVFARFSFVIRLFTSRSHSWPSAPLKRGMAMM